MHNYNVIESILYKLLIGKSATNYINYCMEWSDDAMTGSLIKIQKRLTFFKLQRSGGEASTKFSSI
jgi:hypothetical protein